MARSDRQSSEHKTRSPEHKKSKPNRSNARCRFLVVFLMYIRRIYDYICDLIFGFLYRSVEIKKIPPISNPLLKESAVSLADKIRKKEVTSEKIVTAFIERIKEVNSIVNSVIDYRFEKALEEAKAADEFIRQGTMSYDELKMKKPLLGLPFTAKESTAAEGMSFTLGLVSRKGMKATEDSYLVERLKSTGAVLIGMTNAPELNLWVETRNNIFGQTNNPYNTNRIVGGSSGGEASIVCCCGSPLGLGTDIGGSTRLPAYFCGVYGHMLTGGLINSRGMTFRTGKEKRTILSAGPITRFVEDLKPASIALVLPEKIHLLKLDVEVDVKKLNYFYVTNPGDRRISPIDSELINVLLKVVRLIKEDTGFDNCPQKAYFAGFKYSYTLWRYWMSREESHFPTDLGNQGKPVNVFTEVPKKLIGQSNHTLSAIMKLCDMKLPYPSKTWAENETQTLRDQIIAKLEENGILLFPSYPSTAPYHYEPFTRPYNFAYWAIFNALQLPVTQIPLGLAKDGLPVGIQIVAGPHQDHLCFAVAEYITKLNGGGWVPPFPTND